LREGTGSTSILQPGCTKLARCPRKSLKQEVERELTGQETEPWEVIYFKLYKSQLLVVEQALETVGLMLGTDKSRGYCLEMICADFLAEANLENEDPEVLLQSALRFFKFLPGEEGQKFLHHVPRKRRELGPTEAASLVA
jgi:hypothetical protein